MSYDLGTAHGKITLDYEGGRAAERAQKDIDKLGKNSKDTDGNLKRFGKTLAKVFGGLGKAAGILGLSVGLANAAVSAAALGIQLLGILPALASILSLSAGLPAALVAGAAAAGVLKAALLGVGDALTAAFKGDTAKFNKALEKLSPNARNFAKAVNAAVPALKKLQQGLQDAFFSNNIQDALPGLLAGLASLKPRLDGVALGFGNLAKRIATFAGEQKTLDLFARGIDGLRTILAGLDDNLTPLLTGLRAVGLVGADVFQKVADKVGTLAGVFGNWLNQIASDGTLQAWISTATSTLSTLLNIVTKFGSAFGTILSIANKTGGGLLNTISGLADQINAFVNSAEGQEAITGMFTAIMTAAKALSPVVTTLAGKLLGALAPALLRIAEEAGPILLSVVNALAPAFGPLANAIADLVIAIAPLLPPIAQLVSLLATTLAGALSTLAAELGPVISLIGDALGGAVRELLPVILEAAKTALPLAAQAGAALAKALVPLVPVIIELARAFAEAILPVLPQLQQVIVSKLLPAIIQLVQVLSGELLDTLISIIPMVPSLVSAFVTMVSIMVTIFTTTIRVVTALAQFGAWLKSLPGAVIGLGKAIVSGIVNGLTAAYNGIVSFGSKAFAFFASLPAKVGAFLASLPGVLANAAKTALDAMLFAIGFGIGLAIKTFTTFIPRAIGVLASLPGKLGALAVSAWNALVARTQAGIASAVSFARTLPGRITGAISSLGSTLASAASSAWNRLRSAFSTGISNAVSIARGLPGKIRSAIGNLGSTLFGLGADLIHGLINGIESMVGRLQDIVGNMVGKVKDGIASALKIGSPSRVTFEYGAWTAEGFINGIKSLIGKVVAATSKLSEAATPVVPTMVGVAGNVSPPPDFPRGGFPPAAPAMQVNQTVNALPGMDARAVGNYAIGKLVLAAKTGVGAITTPPPTPAGA